MPISESAEFLEMFEKINSKLAPSFNRTRNKVSTLKRREQTNDLPLADEFFSAEVDDKHVDDLLVELSTCLEYWPLVWRAIRDAVDKGIIVVSAAGNGSENLDSWVYQNPQYHNDPNISRIEWKNPFNRKVSGADSGSIIVGAGAPPSGVYGADRSRLPTSNYGGCVDCQGWGAQVVTAGYGSLQGGYDKDRWYTAEFNGTSSASAMIAGVLACLQGIIKTYNQIITPSLARTLLRETGHPQTDFYGGDNAPNRLSIQRMGNRPDLAQLIDEALKRLGVS